MTKFENEKKEGKFFDEFLNFCYKWWKCQVWIKNSGTLFLTWWKCSGKFMWCFFLPLPPPLWLFLLNSFTFYEESELYSRVSDFRSNSSPSASSQPSFDNPRLLFSKYPVSCLCFSDKILCPKRGLPYFLKMKVEITQKNLFQEEKVVQKMDFFRNIFLFLRLWYSFDFWLLEIYF